MCVVIFVCVQDTCVYLAVVCEEQPVCLQQSDAQAFSENLI